MASQQELEHSAGTHARKTSWTWDRWLETIHDDPDYAFKSTEWYKAGADLEKTKTAPPPASSLADVQCRMFLAQEPLACMGAPTYMVPVLTADPAYRTWVTQETILQLRGRFGRVEGWCDCHGTTYPAAKEFVAAFGLNGPAWGQCETPQEFDHAYSSGCRRMVGNLSVLTEDQLSLVAAGTVHVTVELYRNVMPWQVPDWKNCNAGVGGNTIACYENAGEGAHYMPVSQYKTDGMYVTPRDSVYGVGLHPADWAAL